MKHNLKRRVKIKLNSLVIVNRLTRLFNEARGRGIARIKHKDTDLVMVKLEDFEAMKQSIISYTEQINATLKEITEPQKDYLNAERASLQDQEAVELALARREARKNKD